MPGYLRLLRTVAFVVAVILATGCRDPKFDPYSPHENLLSIAAEFELLAAKNPYRDRPSEDLTGQNVARSTLIRLANYEALHPGRFAPEVALLKARTYELLGDYVQALALFRECAEYDTELRTFARGRAGFLEEVVALLQNPPASSTVEDQLDALGWQSKRFRELAQRQTDAHLAAIALLESENADVAQAELTAASRWTIPNGDQAVLAALEGVVRTHRDSARSLEHALRLARWHRELAEEEARLHAPNRFGFNEDRFRQHAEAALGLYARVAQADGRDERLIARHDLDATLALMESVLNRAD